MIAALIGLGAANLATLFILAHHRASIERLQRRQSELRALLRRHVTMRHQVDTDEETFLAEYADVWDSHRG